MNYFHDMVDNIHQKRSWRPWNERGSICLHLRRRIWNSRVHERSVTSSAHEGTRCRHGEQMTPVWRNSISHAQSPAKTITRIFATGGGGDSDTCHRDNVVTWQRRLRLLSIHTLNYWAEYWLLWKKWWHHVIIGIKHDCVCIAPSRSPGAARQHPREFDTNNTHTIMFDPLINTHYINCGEKILVWETSLIARFMEPTWGPPRSCRPRWALCGPHGPCYLG